MFLMSVDDSKDKNKESKDSRKFEIDVEIPMNID